MFEADQVIDLVIENFDQGVLAIQEAILNGIQDFTGGSAPGDDMTVMVLIREPILGEISEPDQRVKMMGWLGNMTR